MAAGVVAVAVMAVAVMAVVKVPIVDVLGTMAVGLTITDEVETVELSSAMV